MMRSWNALPRPLGPACLTLLALAVAGCEILSSRCSRPEGW